MKKYGFVLSVYDRVDDLDAHLDILKFYPEKAEVIVVYSKKDVPEEYIKKWDKHHLVYCDGINFQIGPLMSLCAGLKKAHKLGLDYIIYRNADDWVLNHFFVMANMAAMYDNNFEIAGYNWLSVNNMTDFALNELILHVPTFAKKVDSMEYYFANSSPYYLCEMKMARWVKLCLSANNKFYRLPEREQFPGVGYEIETLPAFAAYGITLTEDILKRFEKNHRFFNEKWQLIGCHDNQERGFYYNLVREKIQYVNDLEKEENFSRWVDAWTNKKEWNLPSARGTKKGKRDIPASINKPIKGIRPFISLAE